MNIPREQDPAQCSVDEYRTAARAFIELLGGHRLIYLRQQAGSHQKAAVTRPRPITQRDCVRAWQGEIDEIGFLLNQPEFLVFDLDPRDPGARLAPERCLEVAQELADTIGGPAIYLGHFTRRGAHILLLAGDATAARNAMAVDGYISGDCKVERLTRGRLPAQGGRGGFVVQPSYRGQPGRLVTHRDMVCKLLPALPGISRVDSSTYRPVHNNRIVQENEMGDPASLAALLKANPLARGSTYADARRWGVIAGTGGWTYEEMVAAVLDAVGDEGAKRYQGIRKERRRKGVAQHVLALASTSYRLSAEWSPAIRPESAHVAKVRSLVEARAIPWAEWKITPGLLDRYLTDACAHIVRLATMKRAAASIGLVMIAQTMGVELDGAANAPRPVRNVRRIVLAIVQALDLGFIVKTAVRGKHGDILMLTRPWRTALRELLGFKVADEFGQLPWRDGWRRPGATVPHAVEDPQTCNRADVVQIGDRGDTRRFVAAVARRTPPVSPLVVPYDERLRSRGAARDRSANRAQARMVSSGPFGSMPALRLDARNEKGGPPARCSRGHAPTDGLGVVPAVGASAVARHLIWTARGEARLLGRFPEQPKLPGVDDRPVRANVVHSERALPLPDPPVSGSRPLRLHFDSDHGIPPGRQSTNHL